ncbi:MAG: gliding motility-associated ABC transporter ATP-binding subunit GldA [Bacteroidota bacterium]
MSVIVENLAKVFGEQRAVDGISFEAKKGEVMGFLGPNGAGKTTTMRMLTCFIPPTEGKAIVCGQDVLEDPMAVRRQIGYLPEHNPLYKDMFVREYLHFVAQLHKLPKRNVRVAEMIERTGLEREQRKKIGQLSKGYRQRVGLAQAMIHEPQVLILDEPTSGLDPNQLVEIRHLIKQLGEEKTVIFSTHIMQEVQALCDRVVIINRGKMVADDTIDVLRADISKESMVTVEFGQAVTPDTLKKVKGVTRVQALGANRYQLAANVDTDIRQDLFQLATNQKVPLLELRRELESMESIFQQLTNG